MTGAPVSEVVATSRPSDAELASVAVQLEGAHPRDVLGWAARRFPGGAVATSSFGDPLLAHVVSDTDRSIPVVLLDTQYLFAETRWYAERLTQRLGLELRIVEPDVPADDLWNTDTDRCCHVRKVLPLRRALEGADVWVTGLRRSDSPGRRHTPLVGWDDERQVIKVNPLAGFSLADAELYARLHDLPANPLTERGYPSIGCWPCTRPVSPGDDPRSGRWAGEAKTECGLHVSRR